MLSGKECSRTISKNSDAFPKPCKNCGVEEKGTGRKLKNEQIPGDAFANKIMACRLLWQFLPKICLTLRGKTKYYSKIEVNYLKNNDIIFKGRIKD